MTSEHVQGLVFDIFATEIEDAGRNIGYMARLTVQATMPHSRPTTNEIERQNGNMYLSMMAPAKLGLPYGTPPRHILAWVTTEAVRTKSRVLTLGAINSFGDLAGVDGDAR